jgi:hypothetical protein
MLEMTNSRTHTRRRFLAATGAAGIAFAGPSIERLARADDPKAVDDAAIKDKLGIVSASAGHQLSGRKLRELVLLRDMIVRWVKSAKAK